MCKVCKVQFAKAQDLREHYKTHRSENAGPDDALGHGAGSSTGGNSSKDAGSEADSPNKMWACEFPGKKENRANLRLPT